MRDFKDCFFYIQVGLFGCRKYLVIIIGIFTISFLNTTVEPQAPHAKPTTYLNTVQLSSHLAGSMLPATQLYVARGDSEMGICLLLLSLAKHRGRMPKQF